MQKADNKDLAVSAWYPRLADHTFPTSFVHLKPAELQMLADGIQDGKETAAVVAHLEMAMRGLAGNCFVFADSTAPTDTERFAKRKGAVHSAVSAWRFLAKSLKVQRAAAAGEFDTLCVRPFRNMSYPREFRLFIRGGQLSAMSQYWLVRHFKRLEGRKQWFWNKAKALVDEISWQLPRPDVALDVYFTSANQILLIDFNPWGVPTDPLLLRSWNHDWSVPAGIKLMPPPFTVSGDVNVSF